MFNEMRLRYLWCVLIGGVVFISIQPGSSWMCQTVGNNEWNRWEHFLGCLTVVVIPFVAWRSRSAMSLPLIIVISGIVIEFFQMLVTGSHIKPQNVFADLFGVGAGILLGLNLRLMRYSAKSHEELDKNRSGIAPSADTNG